MTTQWLSRDVLEMICDVVDDSGAGTIVKIFIIAQILMNLPSRKLLQLVSEQDYNNDRFDEYYLLGPTLFNLNPTDPKRPGRRYLAEFN